MWLKVKMEASGYPSWVKNHRDEMEYIERYYEREGISLEKDKILRNEALRFIAKIMLNSFWGKLAQRPNQPQTVFLNQFNEYWDLIDDPSKNIKAEYLVTDDVLLANFVEKEEKNGHIGNTNVAVASYVTAWARLELLNIMEKLEAIREGCVLYHDTDSVIYLHEDGDDDVPTGDYLGDLTSEIPENHVCTKFASLGPKNYAYEVKNPDGSKVVHMKVKGIKLNEKVMDLVSFEKFIDMAAKYSRDDTERQVVEVHVPQLQFCIDKAHVVTTREYMKVFRATSLKRRIINAKMTLPYGYVD